MRREILSWSDIDKLVDYLLPQIHGRFDSLVMITRGGIILGGMLAEALNITYVLTASVRFPSDFPGLSIQPEDKFAVPEFLQFPEAELLEGRRVLVVDDVWTRGRNIMTVASRVDAAGGMPETCVLHYKPADSLYPGSTPTYYSAVTDAYIVYPWEIDRDLNMDGAGAGLWN